MYSQYTMMVDYKYDFSIEKDSILMQTRGFGFRDIIDAIDSGNLLRNLKNPSKRYPNQRIFVVKVKNYIYLVPYVIDSKRKKFFLKTFYPSRKAVKKYLK